MISMKGAPLALPSFATAQFRSFFDSGRAVRCMLPLGTGRFMHLVVLYGYQGADLDPEQLALTELLFGAALGELHVVCSWSAFSYCWGFQRGAHQNPLAWQKGSRLGSGFDFRGSMGSCCWIATSPTCKRDWILLVVIVGTLWLVALLLQLLLFFSCKRSGLVDGLLLG